MNSTSSLKAPKVSAVAITAILSVSAVGITAILNTVSGFPY